ncbi:MAG: hypothetical protein HQK64_03485 [Desulfamplus sp.]|nr:hypothetical protein [Desulfamplus sp.]MBF0389852.1 hypothetical protein [Desulfamplus sp.]
MGLRKVKQQVYELLLLDDEKKAVEELLKISPAKSINPLFSFIQNSDEAIKWRAVRAMGQVVAQIALENLESARVVMRRLMWSLNDESGGIGWGAPEAMGEIMAQDKRLYDEYYKILLSYLDEDGNFLEYEPLRKGAIWAVERLSSPALLFSSS